MADELRFDTAEITGKAYRTDAGFLRVPTALTRAGILSYKFRDPKTGQLRIRRELRRPEEVFKAKSMKTMGGVPVTVWSHPPRQLTLENVSAHAKGHVSESVERSDGNLMGGEMVIQDKKAIEAAERGDLKDVSPGYIARILHKPGTYQGKPYDVEQVDIRYNHVALLPPGRGRSGPEVGIRMDSDEEDISCAWQVREDDEESSAETTPPQKENKMETTEIRVDGVDCTVEKTSAKVIEKHLGVIEGRADSLEAKSEELTKELETVKGERDQLKERLDAVDAEIQKAQTAKLAAEVKELVSEVKLDGLSDREIKEAVIKAKSKNDPSDWSDDYLQGRFDSLCDDIRKGKKGIEEGRKGLPTTEVKTDAKDKVGIAAKARAEMIKRNQEAHKASTK